jgi:hypothetical protein
MIQFPTIRATHIEREAEKANNEKAATGIDPREILDSLYVFPNGMWFASDFNEEQFKDRPLSSGLVDGERLLLFNPVGPDQYDRQVLRGFKVESKEVVEKEAMKKELEPLLRHLPPSMEIQPLPQRDGERAKGDAPRPNL